ncbi:molybdopterin-guanine dinucleotide biosynthesis protein A [Patulibacter medicamentivorans]|uniref:Molybdopterin-guanine dinucleotide biosynthesis protein A n=1 Tax=Patulibacter medicamentivorans TaxID=1097667 RepID=H0E2W7_9ACTN|nr:NTP transferase domain-containing protein [Patulibacter medicamentivorans]EHN11984.1 molybdopterin-guanine dinucleotide biosynthesis protein A [Patulibacter medicamentivorans]
MEPVTASLPLVILAGGVSRRMGAPKAAALLGGRPLLAHAIDAARAAGLRPVVLAKADSPLPPLDVERWPEPDEPRHPLIGIASALHRAAGPIVVLPVDLPCVPPGLLRALAERPEPLVVVEAAGRLHPLLGRFDPIHAVALQAAAEAGDPVVRTVLGLGAVRIGEEAVGRFGDPATLLANVNRPEDLAALRATHGG